MKTIKIADMTLRQAASSQSFSLSFKEKLELVRELDRLGTDVIETAPITDGKTDALLIRTLASITKNSVLSCAAGLTTESVNAAWEAVKGATKPRLHVIVPVSPVQMEYVCGKKPDAILALITELVSESAKLCPDVEFSADDAMRAEPEFLSAAVTAAIEAGAKIVTLCDTAGTFMPDEFAGFIAGLYERAPVMQKAELSIQCSNELNMAAACVFASIAAGASQIKCTVNGKGYPSLDALAHIFTTRGESLAIRTGIDMTGLLRSIGGMTWMINTERRGTSAFDNDMNRVSGAELSLDETSTAADVHRALASAGYDLSPDDEARVYEAFRRIAVKKTVNARELDVIVASAAMQVPPTYKLISYVINSGNIISATANIVVEKDGKEIRGVVNGDGPVDAAFLAIEQVAGRHYELDDFQIQAVTEGREAVGSAVIRLRSDGKLFTGKGVSTDIVGASIRAYMDALNKIVYEENM